MTIETAPSTTLDLKGLNCPLPALRTLKALKAMSPGATLIVECTDPMAAIDVPHCVFANGDAIECQSNDGGVLRFRIRRKGRESTPSAETAAGQL
jgi:tRNA 2-thiouridine synthesizing protein A